MVYPPPTKGEEEEEACGDVFEGFLNNGTKEGMGKYTWSSGIVYDGNYKNNEKHGYGVLELPNGDRFEGRETLLLVLLRF